MVQENVDLLIAEGKLQVNFKRYRFAEGIVGLCSDFHQQIDVAATCAVVDSRTEQPTRVPSPKRWRAVRRMISACSAVRRMLSRRGMMMRF